MSIRRKNSEGKQNGLFPEGHGRNKGKNGRRADEGGNLFRLGKLQEVEEGRQRRAAGREETKREES